MTKFVQFVGATALVGTLVACGGGGGGTPATTTSPALDSVASMTYKAKSKTSMSFTPWETVELVPVISGNLGSAATTFSAFPALPSGLILNSTTGAITGKFDDLKSKNFQVSVSMAATGFTRNITSSASVVQEGQLSESGSCGAGFTLTGGNPAGGWNCSGSNAVAGTINFAATYTLNNVLGSPFPAGAIFNYVLVSTTATGAAINPATGVISWTPTGLGTFTFQWASDVTSGGVVRRYTGSTVTLTVT